MYRCSDRMKPHFYAQRAITKPVIGTSASIDITVGALGDPLAPFLVFDCAVEGEVSDLCLVELSAQAPIVFWNSKMAGPATVVSSETLVALGWATVMYTVPLSAFGIVTLPPATVAFKGANPVMK